MVVFCARHVGVYLDRPIDPCGILDLEALSNWSWTDDSASGHDMSVHYLSWPKTL